jgi:superfamily II DNA/RNA helicase
MAVQAKGWELEKSEVETLLRLARSTEAQGTDAKAEALLELIYKLQQEENDPELKVLIFTEFVPTQAMLAELPGEPGLLGGDAQRQHGSRRALAGSEGHSPNDVRVLISTDAGGEGLNLQFCHVIVNFDMPWNPMRVEQRIGRVDRIGQPHVVRAINFVLEDTVEHRVRQVLEAKLDHRRGVRRRQSRRRDGFGRGRPDVRRTVRAGIAEPGRHRTKCDAVVSQLRSTTLAESQKSSDLLADGHDLDADDARKWRDHPAQFWLERAITSGLGCARRLEATKDGNAWRVKWADGSESANACFDARTAEEQSRDGVGNDGRPPSSRTHQRTAALCGRPAACR